MNWFERYGVVGGYFLFILIIWAYAITDIKIDFNDAKNILGLALILPFGYLISIFSQYLYYSGFCGRMVHNEIGEIIRQHNQFQKDIKLESNFSEEENEAIITYWNRMKFFNSKLESFKYLAGFATKRFDVISINNSLIIATILAPLAVAIGNIFLNDMKFRYSEMLWIALIFSASVLVITNGSNQKLNNQILLVNKEIFKSRGVQTDFEDKRLKLIQRIKKYFLNKAPHPLAYLIIFILFFVCLYIFIKYVNLVNHLI